MAPSNAPMFSRALVLPPPGLAFASSPPREDATFEECGRSTACRTTPAMGKRRPSTARDIIGPSGAHSMASPPCDGPASFSPRRHILRRRAEAPGLDTSLRGEAEHTPMLPSPSPSQGARLAPRRRGGNAGGDRHRAVLRPLFPSRRATKKTAARRISRPPHDVVCSAVEGYHCFLRFSASAWACSSKVAKPAWCMASSTVKDQSQLE